MKQVNIYLSGGTVSGWQDVVYDAIEREFGSRDDVHIGILDPRQFFAQKYPLNVQTAMQRAAYREAHIFFGYYEASNPKGLGVFAELSFAAGIRVERAALGLQDGVPEVILVDEHNNPTTRWLAELTEAHVEKMLELGVPYLLGRIHAALEVDNGRAAD